MTDTLAPPESKPADAPAAGSADSRPYVGPRPFEQAEAHLFFGREREARDLLSFIIANQIFVLYSQSGAGKSSLLNTKVIPRCREQNALVLPVVRVQGKIPPEVGEGEIRNVFVANVLCSLRSALPEGSSLDAYKATIPDAIEAIRSAAAEHENIILICDQFEELFTFYEHRWMERVGLLQEIALSLHRFPELKVVLSLREDYIAKLDAFAGMFPNKLRARYRLERLQAAAAVAAVVGPVGQTRRRYDTEVVDLIVKDLLETHARDLQGNTVRVPGEFVEPVQLQVVCSNLWDSVPASETVITAEHLKKSGSVDDALRRFYDAELRAAVLESSIPERRLREWFEKDLITQAGTRGTVFRGEESTAGIPNKVVDTLENKHLVRGDWRAGAQWYEITHDRLLRPIRDSNRVWLKRSARLRYSLLAAVAGAAVIAIVALATWQQRSALQRAEMQARAEQEEARAKQEEARAKQEEAQALERATTVAVQSSKLPASNLPLALLLAVEAFKTSNTALTRSNLLTQVLRGDRIIRQDRITEREIVAAAHIPGTDLIAFTTTDPKLVIWDYRTARSLQALLREPATELFADADRVYVVANTDVQTFEVPSIKAGTLARSQATGPLVERLRAALRTLPAANTDATRSLNPQNEVAPRRRIALAAGRVATSNGGKLLITEYKDGKKVEIELVARKLEEARIDDFGLSADGKLAYTVACEVASPERRGASAPRRIANLCESYEAQFWRVDTKGEVRTLISRYDRMPQVAVGHFDGRVLIATHGSRDDATVTIASAGVGDEYSSRLFNIEVPTPLRNLVLAGNADAMISVSGGSAVTSWRLKSGGGIAKQLFAGFPYDLAAKAQTVAAIGPRGVVVRSDGRERAVAPMPASASKDFALALALDGSQILTAENDTLRLRPSSLDGLLFTTSIARRRVSSAALDPAAQYVAASYDPRNTPGTALPRVSEAPIVWHAASGRPVLTTTLAAPSSNDRRDAGESRTRIAGVAFSPLGSYFAMTEGGREREGNVVLYAIDRSNSASPFREIDRLPITDGEPLYLAFSPDEQKLAVSGSTSGVIVFDVLSKKPLIKLSAESGADTNATYRMAFSHDGRWLAADSNNGLQLWDLESRSLIGTFSRTSALVGAAFSPDGRQLLTGDELLDSVIAYDLTIDAWVARACGIAGRELTDEERTTYQLRTEAAKPCASR